MQNVLLASTLHDPNGVLLDPLKQAIDIVSSHYEGWVLNISAETDPRIKELLKSLRERGIYVTEPDSANSIVANKIENDHLNVLREALFVAKALGVDKIQYTDGDRIVVAARHFPKDLGEMARLAGEIVGDTKSYLNFRRSAEDYFSRHTPLVETEFEINRLYSKVFGITLDITSTAHVMSRDLVGEVLSRSPQMEPINFPHPKWLIIARETGAGISSVETHNVLTFETPEQFKAQVSEEIAKGRFEKATEKKEGEVQRSKLQVTDIERDYSLLQQTHMATLGIKNSQNPKEWRLRFTTERQYLTLLLDHLDIFGFNTQQKESLQGELQGSLRLLEGRQEVIAEALKWSPEYRQEVIAELRERSDKGPER